MTAAGRWPCPPAGPAGHRQRCRGKTDVSSGPRNSAAPHGDGDRAPGAPQTCAGSRGLPARHTGGTSPLCQPGTMLGFSSPKALFFFFFFPSVTHPRPQQGGEGANPHLGGLIPAWGPLTPDYAALRRGCGKGWGVGRSGGTPGPIRPPPGTDRGRVVTGDLSRHGDPPPSLPILQTLASCPPYHHLHHLLVTCVANWGPGDRQAH